MLGSRRFGGVRERIEQALSQDVIPVSPISSFDRPREVRFDSGSSSSEYAKPRSMTPRAVSLAENTDTVPPDSGGSSNTSGPVSRRTA